jgi:hypothetical protein
VMLQRELAIGSTEVVLGRLASDPEYFVEISFGAHGLRLIGRTRAAVN